MIKKITTLTAFIATTILAGNVSAQNMESQRVSVTIKDSEAIKKDTVVGKPSITHHQMTVDGKIVTYTATAGYMPMRDKDDKLIAKIFYVAYVGDNTGSKTKRPVTFVFNGGPGSASIWLHMGSFSPVRVKFADDKGDAPAPPYQYEENPYTWLGFTDLVFIDPVSTGFSRPQKGVDAGLFHSYSKDVTSVGDFIRLYITKNERWDSPKFIAGESYGTTRAAGLSGYLQDRYGMYLNGITLISSVLNFQLIDFKNGNEMPYVYFLPTYANTAQYFHKLSPGLQSLSPAELTKKSEIFANGAYSYFLSLGDEAPADLTNRVVDSLNYFTGIPKDYIRSANERITDGRFFKEVLRDEGKITGRYDSRFTGEDIDNAGEYPSYDPSNANLAGSFVGAFNTYLRKDLKYVNDIPYESSTDVSPWDLKPFGGYAGGDDSYLDVSETLRAAMTQNPHLKVNVVCGYYDLATPVFNAEYVVSHMGLRPDVRKNIILNYYKAGHMVYVSKETDTKFKADAELFYQNALK